MSKDFPLLKAVVTNAIQLHWGVVLQYRLGLWTLQRHERHVRTSIGDLCLAVDLARDPLEIRRLVGGVDHEQEFLGTEAIDQKVIDVGTPLGEESTVVCPPRLELGDIVGCQPLQSLFGLGTAHGQLPHVRHIEQTGGLSHGPMLVDDSRVLDRHFPAGELHQLGASFNVTLIERRAMQGLGAGHRADSWRSSRETRTVASNRL